MKKIGVNAEIKVTSEWSAMSNQEKREYISSMLRKAADEHDKWAEIASVRRDMNGNARSVKVRV